MPHASIATVCGASFARNGNTSMRRNLRVLTTAPVLSLPWNWNTLLAKSNPLVLIIVMDGSFCV